MQIPNFKTNTIVAFFLPEFYRAERRTAVKTIEAVKVSITLYGTSVPVPEYHSSYGGYCRYDL